MPYSDLQEFVAALEQAGELHRITVPVSPMLEVAQITDRVSKSPCPTISPAAQSTDPKHADLGGKALLFENIQGTSMPLLINAYGSYRRTELALGCDAATGGGGFAQLADRIGKLAKPEPPATLVDKFKKIPELMEIARTPPKLVRHGHCQDTIRRGDEVNLLELPIIKCWPHDGDPAAMGFGMTPDQAGTAPGQGRFITFGQMLTIHPDDVDKKPGQPRPSRNIGMYRAQLIDRNHTAMHWHMHHDGARHWRAWKTRREQDAEFAARYPGMPLAISFGGPSVMPYAATAPMPPGISEFMLAGFLNGQGIAVVPGVDIPFEVSAQAELVLEGYVATEADPPGLTRQDIEHAAATHNQLPGQGQVLEGPFGDHTGFYSLPDRYPIFTVAAMTHRKSPIFPATIVGLPPQEDYYLGKATERLFLPLLQTLIPDIVDYDLPMFGAFHNCAFVQIKKEYPLQARRVMHAIWGAGQMAWTKSIVVVDHDVDVHDHEAVLFHLCANCDPARDIEVVRGPVDILDHAAPVMGAASKIGFDATRKIPGENVGGHAVRDFPPVLEMDEATKKLVDERWAEYGLG